MSSRRSDVLIDSESDSSDLESFLDSSRKGVKKPRVNQQKSRSSKVRKVQQSKESAVDPRPSQVSENGEAGGVSLQNALSKDGLALIVSEVVKAFREKDVELPSVPENPYQQIAGESIIVL